MPRKWGYVRVAHIYVSPSQEKSTEFLCAHRRARNWSDQDLPLRNSASRPMIPASSRTTHPFAVEDSGESAQKIEFVFSASPETIQREPPEFSLLRTVANLRGLAVCASE